MKQHIFRKGQAAMEFLMTYGWALLVIIIAIAALAYLGVTSPSNFVGENCLVPPGFTCVDQVLLRTTAGTANVNITLSQNRGENLANFNLTIAPSASTIVCARTDPVGTTDETEFTVTFNESVNTKFIFNCTGLSAGDRFKADLSLDWTSAATGSPHSGSGSVSTEVQ